MTILTKFARVSFVLSISVLSLNAEQVALGKVKIDILSKTIQILRPFENIKLDYTVQEKNEKSQWDLVERIRVTRNLSGTKQKYFSVVRSNGVFSQRTETQDGQKYMLVDRVCADNPNLDFSIKYLDGGSGAVTLTKLDRIEPYLQVYKGAFGQGLLSELLADPDTKIQVEADPENEAGKNVRLRINQNQRLIVNQNTGQIVEKATESVDSEGKVYDYSNLVVDKSILIDGRQVPISFTIRYNSGKMQRYEIDPGSVKFNADFKDELFEVKFPVGCSVTDNINQTSYTVTGLDTKDETEKLIEAIDRSLINPK